MQCLLHTWYALVFKEDVDVRSWSLIQLYGVCMREQDQGGDLNILLLEILEE